MKDPQASFRSALVIVLCSRRPCNESHSPCYSAQSNRMRRCVTICFACWCFICLASLLFAASSLESTLSTEGWLSSALEQISVERMLADIRALSGPAYGGRLTGSAQDEASATFIANRFSELRFHRSLALPPDSQTNPLPQREWKQTTTVSTRRIA